MASSSSRGCPVCMESHLAPWDHGQHAEDHRVERWRELGSSMASHSCRINQGWTLPAVVLLSVRDEGFPYCLNSFIWVLYDLKPSN